MKKIRRSRQIYLSHQRHALRKTVANDDNDDSKDALRANQNTNRTVTSVFESITNLPDENKTLQIVPSSSDQSSLFLYSINSIQKPTVISDDLTPLTITTSNTTPLTALTVSNTKQTETATVKIDLRQSSRTDVADNSSANSDHDLSLSTNRKFSSANLTNILKELIPIDDTDVSMKSVVFSKENSLKQERLYEKQTSYFIIPCQQENQSSIKAEKPFTISQVDFNAKHDTFQQSSIRSNLYKWNFPKMTMEFKLLIICIMLSLFTLTLLIIIIL